MAKILGWTHNNIIILADDVDEETTRPVQVNDIVSWPGEKGYFLVTEKGARGLKFRDFTAQVEAELERRAGVLHRCISPRKQPELVTA